MGHNSLVDSSTHEFGLYMGHNSLVDSSTNEFGPYMGHNSLVDSSTPEFGPYLACAEQLAPTRPTRCSPACRAGPSGGVDPQHAQGTAIQTLRLPTSSKIEPQKTISPDSRPTTTSARYMQICPSFSSEDTQLSQQVSRRENPGLTLAETPTRQHNVGPNLNHRHADFLSPYYGWRKDLRPHSN